jgi:hypothetical protein
MPPTARSVYVDFPEAARLADLQSISYDLLRSRDYVQKYLDIASANFRTNDSSHIDCFTAFAFILYGRCFKGGVRRTTERGLLSAMNEEDRQIHKLIIDLRDKHYAHSVNEMEQHKASIWLNPEEHGRKITSVSIGSHYTIAPDVAFMTNMVILIDRIRAWVITEQKIESKRLKEIAEERFPIDMLYELENSHYKPKRSVDPSKSRKYS